MQGIPPIKAPLPIWWQGWSKMIISSFSMLKKKKKPSLEIAPKGLFWKIIKKKKKKDYITLEYLRFTAFPSPPIMKMLLSQNNIKE